MPSPLLLPVVTCAVVLLVSGVAKLRAPAAVDTAFTSLGVPSVLDTPLVRRLVPWVEVALGAWLLLATGPALVVVGGLTLLLFLAYLVLVVRALRRPEPVDCGCFGALGDSEVTTVTVWRNALLVASAALAVVAGLQGSGLVPALLDDAQVLAWLAGAALAAAVAVLVTYRGTTTDTTSSGTAHGAPHGAPHLTAPTVDDDGDYVRSEAPLMTFLDEQGELLALEHSVREGAHLLVFLAPYCGPCQRVAPLLPQWAARLHPVRVKAVLLGQPSLLHDRDDLAVLRGHAWFDPYSTARRQVGAGSPGAVLIGVDGLLAGGPVTGELAVTEFVEEVADQLREAREAGELPDAHEHVGPNLA